MSYRYYEQVFFFRVLLVVGAVLGSARLQGAPGSIQCANLIFAGTQTSRCFSDQFLTAAQQQTSVTTERRFKKVKLNSDELFTYPFVVMTGEQQFRFSAKERENLKRYVESGGFLLASAGCSSAEWDKAFRREIKTIFADKSLTKIDMKHPVFKTVKSIEKLELAKGKGSAFLEGLEHDGKLVMIYSSQGLNDTEHTTGCCCCGGNEIQNSMDVNVNILVYALMH
ncbi:MAG: DUF4159 domain-containing protein [Kiritimatiellae bacterium]|nr:DUF4159 domain-containing protein [Kiritimatiellia bacterium]